MRKKFKIAALSTFMLTLSLNLHSQDISPEMQLTFRLLTSVKEDISQQMVEHLTDNIGRDLEGEWFEAISAADSNATKIFLTKYFSAECQKKLNKGYSVYVERCKVLELQALPKFFITSLLFGIVCDELFTRGKYELDLIKKRKEISNYPNEGWSSRDKVWWRMMKRFSLLLKQKEHVGMYLAFLNTFYYSDLTRDEALKMKEMQAGLNALAFTLADLRKIEKDFKELKMDGYDGGEEREFIISSIVSILAKYRAK